MLKVDNSRGWWDERRRLEAADRWREDFQLAISLGAPNPVEWASLASLATREGDDVPIERALCQYESTKVTVIPDFGPFPVTGDEPRR